VGLKKSDRNLIDWVQAVQRCSHTFKNSATFAAHCCCSYVLELPSHINIAFPDCNTKHSVELKDVATYKMITGQLNDKKFTKALCGGICRVNIIL